MAARRLQSSVRMNLIGAAGTQLGTGFPQFPLTDDTEKLRRTFLRTMAYATPPGSGNAYSREFVRAAFAMAPVPEEQIAGETRPCEPGEATLWVSDGSADDPGTHFGGCLN